jgi:Na+-transporting methylmalonyl-CoA/oxaloacetate decarboxylase gamma subunit
MKENKFIWFLIGTGFVLIVLLLLAIITTNLKDSHLAKGIDDDVKHPELLFS